MFPSAVIIAILAISSDFTEGKPQKLHSIESYVDKTPFGDRNAIVIKVKIDKNDRGERNGKRDVSNKSRSSSDDDGDLVAVDVNKGEAPYQVVIGQRHWDGRLDVHCSGALIAKQWLLTAAHCVEGFGAEKQLDVALGKRNVDEGGPREQWFAVERVFIHKDYDKESGRDDIALVLLDHPARIDDWVKPVHLPLVEHQASFGNGTISGWGAQRWKGPVSAKLKKVVVPILSPSKCRQLRKGETTKHGAEICAEAGSGPDSVAVCGTGDSGGPLVCSEFLDDADGGGSSSNGTNGNKTSSNNAAGKAGAGREDPPPAGGSNRTKSVLDLPEQEYFRPPGMKNSRQDVRFYVCGIMSHSTKCNAPGQPAVFTKVSHYLDWIKKTVKKAEEEREKRDLEDSEYPPYLALVNRVPVDGPKKYRSRCMGTILNEIFVLTSADCLIPTSDHVCYYWVALGNQSEDGKQQGYQRLPVADFFLFHPERFLLQMADPRKRDRGLTDSIDDDRNKPVVLQMARSVSINKWAFPVHLPTSNNFQGLTAKVLSFKLKNSEELPDNFTRKHVPLVTGDFIIVPPWNCPASMLEDYNLNRTNSICAKHVSGLGCSEYLPGSPLVCQSKLPTSAHVIGGERFLCGLLAKPGNGSKTPSKETKRSDSKSSRLKRQSSKESPEKGDGKTDAGDAAAPEYCLFRKLWVDEQRTD